MGFFKELGKIGKKVVKSVPAIAGGFLTGGPAGAIAAGIGGLLGPSGSGGGGGGGGGAASIPELDNLRRSLASQAAPLATDVINQTNAVNNAIRASRAATEESLMSAAVQSGAINTAQEAEIRAIAAQTGLALGDAMDQILGEEGVVQVFQQLEQQFPDIVNAAAAENERLVAASQELSGVANTIQQQFPELVQQNTGLLDQLQGISQQSQQFVDAVAGLTPSASANIAAAQGLQSTFQGIGQSAQTLGAQAFDAGEALVQSTEQDLAAQEAQEMEQLKDVLLSQNLLDSGAGIAAMQKLQDQQGRRRATVTAQVRQQAQAQTFGQQAQALGLETGAAQGQTGAVATTGQQIAGAADVAQTGAGVVNQGAQNVGLQSQVLQGSGSLLQAQQQLVNSGQAILDSQGRLIDTQTGRELQAAEAVSRAAQNRGSATTTGANLALTAGGVQERAATTGAGLQRDTVAGMEGAKQAVAKLAPGIEGAVLENTRGTQRDLTQQGLTGTAAQITSNQRQAELSDEAQRQTQADLQRGIQKVFDEGMISKVTTGVKNLFGGKQVTPPNPFFVPTQEPLRPPSQ